MQVWRLKKGFPVRKVSVGQPPSSSSEGQSVYCQSTISLWKDKTAICNTEELGVLWGGEELICVGSQLPARLSLRTWVHCHPLQPGLLTHSKLQENQTCHAENNSIRDENGKKQLLFWSKRATGTCGVYSYQQYTPLRQRHVCLCEPMSPLFSAGFDD